MRKAVMTVVGCCSVVMLMISSLFFSGCKISPEQAKVIAQNAGLYSAVIWIAIDNPSAEQIGQVKGLLGAIKEHATKIEKGKTYMEVVYPEVVKIIDEKIPAQDRPLCKVASMTIINGIDTLFAMHPEWKEDQNIAIQIVNSYIVGAENGLGMDEDSDVMRQARSTATARARVFTPEEPKKRGFFKK